MSDVNNTRANGHTNSYTNGRQNPSNGTQGPFTLLGPNEDINDPSIEWLKHLENFMQKNGLGGRYRWIEEGPNEGPWTSTLLVNNIDLGVRGYGNSKQKAKNNLVKQLEHRRHELLFPTVDLDSEARLYATNAEREKYESQAILFGIIVALEYLERAYVRDAINAAEYTPACTRLLSQYKTMLKLVGDSVPSVEEFMRRYNMDHPAALHRVQVGVPATIEHSSEQQGSAETAKWVAETTQSFITFMDALNLKLRAKDQLHPRLQELMTGYARFKDSAKWEGRGKIVSWLITLNAMKASDEISDDQARQLLFDIDHAYHEFFSSLGGGKDNT
ncbi:Vacuolar protein sorting-associated protein 28 AltName: Full=ESCRT-I complex subunit VPS28 [Rhizoctonia solani AG-1 IB]|uniref:Rhizoctonia solani AG1-IB WGS project CAOJ00000000 data, isolate 7/3/14, contig 05357 n=1 Tax=Thanatephorus cucumeris (strain AG1-IB / isolate 7/3/14) TaxID=1108050 RepID=M5BNT6_THACB|nr:Vacuolar protein sorting-associated protein 28 AltName: Full=ESCRT-I complex subunit VPS28 [Rhizoctonia solani AG-1 IB]